MARTKQLEQEERTRARQAFTDDADGDNTHSTHDNDDPEAAAAAAIVEGLIEGYSDSESEGDRLLDGDDDDDSVTGYGMEGSLELERSPPGVKGLGAISL